MEKNLGEKSLGKQLLGENFARLYIRTHRSSPFLAISESKFGDSADAYAIVNVSCRVRIYRQGRYREGAGAVVAPSPPPPPSGIRPPADPKGPLFRTLEIHFWPTDPKIFLKAPLILKGGARQKNAFFCPNFPKNAQKKFGARLRSLQF